MEIDAYDLKGRLLSEIIRAAVEPGQYEAKTVKIHVNSQVVIYSVKFNGDVLGTLKTIIVR